MRRAHLILLAVLGMGLLAGCMDVTVTTEVGADGDIDQLDVDMEVDPMMYGVLEESAQEEGYDSVEEMLADDFGEDMGTDADDLSVTVTEPGERDADEYLISMSAAGVDVDDLEDIETTVEEDTVRVTDTSIGGGIDADEPEDIDDIDGFGDALEEGVTFEYVVVMPGEIQDHNADELSDDGTVATWHLHEGEPDEQLYAESTVDDSVPGFGIAAGLLGLLLGIAVLGRRLVRP